MVKKMLNILLFFANSSWAQALMVYNLHEQYHFIERHVPMNKNQVINAWFVEQFINNYGLFQNSRCEINYR